MDTQIKRQMVKDNLTVAFNSSLDARVNRCLDIGHQWIIGNHHFAMASSECINVYRDGHFIAACSETTFADKLTIVIATQDIVKHHISLDDLGLFLRHECLYASFSRGNQQAVGTPA